MTAHWNVSHRWAPDVGQCFVRRRILKRDLYQLDGNWGVEGSRQQTSKTHWALVLERLTLVSFATLDLSSHICYSQSSSETRTGGPRWTACVRRWHKTEVRRISWLNKKGWAKPQRHASQGTLHSTWPILIHSKDLWIETRIDLWTKRELQKVRWMSGYRRRCGKGGRWRSMTTSLCAWSRSAIYEHWILSLDCQH
jgi:hypothetical protein